MGGNAKASASTLLLCSVIVVLLIQCYLQYTNIGSPRDTGIRIRVLLHA